MPHSSRYGRSAGWAMRCGVGECSVEEGRSVPKEEGGPLQRARSGRGVEGGGGDAVELIPAGAVVEAGHFVGGGTLQIEAAGGEGDGEAAGLDGPHDAAINALADVHVLEPGDGLGEIVDEDVEGALAEVGEADEDELLLDAVVLTENLADVLDEVGHVVGGGFVGDADDLLDAALGHAGPVVDVFVGEDAVGDGDDGLGPGADFGGAEADGLDVAVDFVTDLDPVTDLKGTVEGDHHGAEGVLEGVLGGEGDGGGAEAEGGEDAGDVVAEVVDRHEDADDEDEDEDENNDNNEELDKEFLELKAEVEKRISSSIENEIDDFGGNEPVNFSDIKTEN